MASERELAGCVVATLVRAQGVAMTESHDEPLIRLATLEDAPGMARVLESAFGRWPPFEVDVAAVDHLRWKMASPGPAAHTVVEADGEIVGVSLRWVSQIQVGGEVFEQDSAIDQAILPAMQGRGLGGKLVSFTHARAIEYSDMAFGSGSNNPSMAGLFDRVDPTLVEYPVTVWTRPFGLRSFVGRHRVGGIAHLLRSLASRLRRRGGSSAPLPGVEIEPLERFDERVDGLWAAVSPSFQVSLVRDAARLNWRYGDPRAGRSVVFGATEAGRLVGYVVAKRSGSWAQILDLVCDPARPELGSRLLDRACESMRADGARGLDCWLSSGDPLEPALSGAGFLDSGEVRQVGLGPQRRRERPPEALHSLYAGTARVHVMAGDLELA